MAIQDIFTEDSYMFTSYYQCNQKLKIKKIAIQDRREGWDLVAERVFKV